MKTKLILIRHGETVWNTERRVQGRKDSVLTTNGITQSAVLQEYLATVAVDYCYCSPQQRARRTAEFALANKKVPCILDERLSEINLGCWEGRKIADLETDFPDDYVQFYNGAININFGGGENLKEVQQRVMAALDEYARKHSGETIAVVSHGMALAAALCALNGVELNGRTYKQKNGCLNIVEYQSGKWIVTLQNHIPRSAGSGKLTSLEL
ncbi:MAG: histidine phosphatase family protein [Bacillota bacterium]